MAATIRCAECPLRRRDAFRALPPEQIAFIQEMKIGERRFAPGETLMRQGARRGDLLTLLEGWAFRHKTLEGGRRQILNFLLPGDLIGLQRHMEGESPHAVEALTPARACVLDGSKLWELYHRFPSMGFDVTWLACAEESIVDTNLLFVGQYSALPRIAALLESLQHRVDAHGPDAAAALPLSQQHLADALGLSVVHVQRSLRLLRQRGAVDVTRGGVRVVDIELLTRLGLRPPGISVPRPLL